MVLFMDERSRNYPLQSECYDQKDYEQAIQKSPVPSYNTRNCQGPNIHNRYRTEY